MIQCPNCGLQQDEGKFCRGCGKPLATTAASDSGFFSSLGNLGDDLSAPAPRREAPPVAPPPVREPAPYRQAPPVAPPPVRESAPYQPAPPVAPPPVRETPPVATPPRTEAPAAPAAKAPVKPMRRISAGKELRLLLRQGLMILFGDKKNLIISLLFPVIAGAVTVWIAGKKMFIDHEGTKGACFILVCAAIWCGLFNSIQTLVKERPNIKRDYVSGALRIECYMGSRSIIQIVLCAIQSLVLTLSVAAMDWVWGNPLPASGLIFEWVLLDFYISLFLVMLASDAMGLMISAMVKKEELASKLAPYILIAQLLFSGMLFKMEGAAQALSAIMISRWGMEALGSISDLNGRNTASFNVFGGEERIAQPCGCQAAHVAQCPNLAAPTGVPCQCPVPQHQGTCAEYVLENIRHVTDEAFETTSEHMWTVWLIMGAFVVVCLVGADVLLHRVKKDGRG